MNALVGTQAPGFVPSIKPRRRCKCSWLSADARYGVMSAEIGSSSRVLQFGSNGASFSATFFPRMHHNTSITESHMRAVGPMHAEWPSEPSSQSQTAYEFVGTAPLDISLQVVMEGECSGRGPCLALPEEC